MNDQLKKENEEIIIQNFINEINPKLWERWKLFRPDYYFAKYLSVVGLLAILERFFIHPETFHIAFFLSGITGAIIVYLLWFKILISIDFLPPFGFDNKNNKTGKFKWLFQTMIKLMIPFIKLVIVSLFGLIVQYFPAIKINITWQKEPFNFFQYLNVPILGQIILESWKDLWWISLFAIMLCYIPGRLKASRLPQFKNSKSLSKNEINWLLFIILFIAVALFLNALFLAIKVTGQPRYFIHIIIQVGGLIASLPGYIIYYRRKWILWVEN